MSAKTTCSGFEIYGELGFGSAARILAARECATGRDVAIKLFGGPDAAEAMRQETLAARRLACVAGLGWRLAPVIGAVLVSVASVEQPALVFERLPGRPLGDWLVRDPRPEPTARLAVLHRVFAALAALHAAGLAHNDLSLGNILVDKSGTVGLVDLDRASAADISGRPRKSGPGAFFDHRGDDTSHAPAHDLRAAAILAVLILAERHPFVMDPTPLLAHAWRGPSPYLTEPRIPAMPPFLSACAAEQWLGPALRLQQGVTAEALLQGAPQRSLL